MINIVEADPTIIAAVSDHVSDLLERMSPTPVSAVIALSPDKSVVESITHITVEHPHCYAANVE
jgi:hypothetical protein